MSERPRIKPEKAKEMQERARERNLVLQEIRNRGPLTIDELSNAIDMEKSEPLKHLMAMMQFGKILIVGERDNQLVYDLPEEDKS